MARVIATLTWKKRWWFPIAYIGGITACGLGLMTEDRAARFVAWLVDKGMKIGVR